RGRSPQAAATEAPDTTAHATAGEARVRNEKRGSRQRQGGQTSKFLQHCGLRCGTKSRRTRLGLENERKREPPVCRLNRRTDFHAKLTQWLEPNLTSPRLNSAREFGRGDMADRRSLGIVGFVFGGVTA